MSRLPPSSDRGAPRRQRGFTLLECQVALLVLTLAVVFLMKMISAHDVLLQDMSGWLVGDTPTYYVVERDNAYERWLEHNADLSTTPAPPQSDDPPYPGDEHLISIMSSSKTMAPPTLSVRVQLRWL